MIDPVLAIFLRKELRDFRSNPQVIPGYLLLPLVAVILPGVIIAIAPAGAVPGADPDFIAMLRFASRDPLLGRFPESERIVRLIVREFGGFFLLMPLILASLSAAASIAAEKQQRTLEPILATPLSTRDFLLAKLVAAVIPSVVLTWIAAVIYVLVVAIVAAVRFDHPFTPGAGFGLSVTLLAPVAAIAAALVGMRASMRAVDTQTAVQTASLWVIPIGALAVGLAGRVAVRSAVAGLATVVLVAAFAVWMFRGNLTRFEREEILTRWK